MRGSVVRRAVGAMLMLAGSVAAVGYALSLAGPAGAKLSGDGDPLGPRPSSDGDVLGLLTSLSLVSLGARVWRRGGSH